jgi:hypothetical protein
VHWVSPTLLDTTYFYWLLLRALSLIFTPFSNRRPDAAQPPCAAAAATAATAWHEAGVEGG